MKNSIPLKKIIIIIILLSALLGLLVVTKFQNIETPVGHAYLLPSCSDSDNGKAASVKGTVESQGLVRSDECTSGKILSEWYCSSTNVGVNTLIECPVKTTCQDGACLP